MHRFAFALLAALILVPMTAARAEQRPETVIFAADPEGAAGPLTAIVYSPQGVGPFPAVVALHGCGGLFNEAGLPSLRHADWGERLAAAGYLVVMPDSFGSRGAIGSQCRARARVATPAGERTADARAALHYLQGRPDVIGDRVALLGWSNGGSTVLAAARPKARPPAGAADFRAAIAFYPGCKGALTAKSWTSRLPLMILIGEADDWTPAAPCVELTAAHRDTITLVTYPEAYHDFDHPGMPVRVIKGTAYSADGSGRVHAGTNVAARTDALQRVMTVLDERLRGR